MCVCVCVCVCAEVVNIQCNHSDPSDDLQRRIIDKPVSKYIKHTCTSQSSMFITLSF